MNENEEYNEQTEEVVNTISIEESIETDVVPIVEIEPYSEQIDELEDHVDDVIEIEEDYYARLTDIPDTSDEVLPESNTEFGEDNEQTEEVVNIIPIEEIIETGIVEIEPYPEQIDELEDHVDDVIEIKEDYYARLTDIPDTSDEVLPESNTEFGEDNEQTEEVVNIIPIEDIIETGTVEPDNTLVEVESNRKKFDELEDQVDNVIEKQESALEDGDLLLADKTQTHLNILDNKEDYYARLTNIPDTIDEVLPESNTEFGEDNEQTEEIVNIIPIEEIIDTGTNVPEGDTLSEIDESRKNEDILDIIIASSAGDVGGADPSINSSHEKTDDELPIVYEENDNTSQSESLLRKDEIKKMNEEEEEDEEEKNEEREIEKEREIISNNFIGNNYER